MRVHPLIGTATGTGRYRDQDRDRGRYRSGTGPVPVPLPVPVPVPVLLWSYILQVDEPRKSSFFLGPVANAQWQVSPPTPRTATRAARLHSLHAAAHHHGRQTWPRGRAAAHARVSRAQRLSHGFASNALGLHGPRVS